MGLSRKSFLILISTITVSGFSQGLLLPLLSVFLEKQGVSSIANGLSASALYIGMLIASPFMERPVRKYGYKPVIIFGLSMVTLAMLLFPIWQNFYFWIVLRFIVGIGDNAIHYASQLWITTTAEPRRRGRVLSMYGLAYGIGFAIGPLGLILASIDFRIPFVITIIFFITILLFVTRLNNLIPESTEEKRVTKNYKKVYVIAGLALMPMFIYGFLEATLNVSFPIYGLRTGLGENVVPILLSSFVIGSLLFQLPLGVISDYIGRKRTLIIITSIGGTLFLLIPLVQTTQFLILMFVLAGGFTGSLYSLGLAYVTDLLPLSLLPTASIIATIHFGLGSMLGPYLSGLSLAYLVPESIFYLIAAIILSFTLLMLVSTVINIIFKKKSSSH